MSKNVAGTILASRRKGTITWIARIGHDRERLEVRAIVPASLTPIEVEPLTEAELIELLDAGHDDEHEAGR